ncbi:unnamed protein product [Adineta steineri]|uniref:Uncharacterized protein n=1 Tax=Adineta steineri TaxID=433720 RepID=A0A813NQE5_9BILA|nr:unnamed protein product [Adineta steineri]CAF4014334.1 unnamed protein product [Adineta steineri]
MHIHSSHFFILSDTIDQCIHHLFNQIPKPSGIHNRSRDAITRRNTNRHIKQIARQQQQTVTRPIDHAWKLHDFKQYLQHKQIRYNRLPEIRKHQGRIQINDIHQYNHAEATLSDDEFSEMNYYKWLNYEH